MPPLTAKTSHWSGAWIVFIALFLGVVLANISEIFRSVDMFDELEARSLDARFRIRGPVKPVPNDIVIVTADDNTDRAINKRWPYSRGIWAHAVDNLKAAGAKVIAFDIQFDAPADSEGDIAFAEAMKRAGNVILSAQITEERSKFLREPIFDILPPEKRFTNAGVTFAVVNVEEDVNRIIRDYNAIYKVNNKNYLSLATKSLLMFRNGPMMPDQLKVADDGVIIGGEHIQTVNDQQIKINYYGPVGTFRTYSLAQVLDDAEFDLAPGEDSDWMELFISPPPPGMDSTLSALAKDNPFKDKIVLIGNSMPAVHDLKPTPFSNFSNRSDLTPGVEVHADALQTMLSGNYLHLLNFWIQFIIWTIMSLGVWYWTEKKSVWFSIITMVSVVLLIVTIDTVLFIKQRLIADFIAPISCVSFSFVVTLFRRILREQKEKTKIKGMFGQYVPKKVVGELIANPGLLRLGGERRRMSVLFSDVAGFTTISENSTPEELVSLLNEYLTAMTREVLNEEGIIDKYEGDLIMAEFGAPVHFEDHAMRAARAAVKMKRKLADLRVKWFTEGRPPLFARTGINTGDMIVGNMGSEDVFDYTVMGDAVNLASRLEGVNKMYGTSIMCSAETMKDLGDAFHYRFLDRVRVKGKTQFVEIFEIIEEATEPLLQEQIEVLEKFAEGRECYDKLQFERAALLFKEALKEFPEDGPSKVFLQRAMEYIENPPDDLWDKVFTLTEK